MRGDLRRHKERGIEPMSLPAASRSNVQQRIASDSQQHKELASVIKYRGDNSTFVWKSPIEFRYGSQLIVHESEAIFSGRSGTRFVRAWTLHTGDPAAAHQQTKAYVLPTNAGEPSIRKSTSNKTVQMALKMGTHRMGIAHRPHGNAFANRRVGNVELDGKRCAKAHREARLAPCGAFPGMTPGFSPVAF